MKFKYCPNCAGISTMQEKGGLHKCWRCNFVGTPSEGTADEINVLVRRLKSGLSASPAAGGAGSAASHPGGLSSAEERNKLREKLRNLKGKKSDDFEFL